MVDDEPSEVERGHPPDTPLHACKEVSGGDFEGASRSSKSWRPEAVACARRSKAKARSSGRTPSPLRSTEPRFSSLVTQVARRVTRRSRSVGPACPNRPPPSTSERPASASPGSSGAARPRVLDANYRTRLRGAGPLAADACPRLLRGQDAHRVGRSGRTRGPLARHRPAQARRLGVPMARAVAGRTPRRADRGDGAALRRDRRGRWTQAGGLLRARHLGGRVLMRAASAAQPSRPRRPPARPQLSSASCV